jgi:hypothetical protein
MQTEFQFLPGPHFLYGKVHRNLRYGLADFCREKKFTPRTISDVDNLNFDILTVGHLEVDKVKDYLHIPTYYVVSTTQFAHIGSILFL